MVYVSVAKLVRMLNGYDDSGWLMYGYMQGLVRVLNNRLTDDPDIQCRFSNVCVWLILECRFEDIFIEKVNIFLGEGMEFLSS